ncbi:hypothetical protein HDU76_012107 [Blyttiomyces sp. JEL0837]|nr:hypothetical protein HDU76_012107 [Blyttiomyces sp. JEL0837]
MGCGASKSPSVVTNAHTGPNSAAVNAKNAALQTAPTGGAKQSDILKTSKAPSAINNDATQNAPAAPSKAPSAIDNIQKQPSSQQVTTPTNVTTVMVAPMVPSASAVSMKAQIETTNDVAPPASISKQPSAITSTVPISNETAVAIPIATISSQPSAVAVESAAYSKEAGEVVAEESATMQLSLVLAPVSKEVRVVPVVEDATSEEQQEPVKDAVSKQPSAIPVDTVVVESGVAADAEQTRDVPAEASEGQGEPMASAISKQASAIGQINVEEPTASEPPGQFGALEVAAVVGATAAVTRAATDANVEVAVVEGDTVVAQAIVEIKSEEAGGQSDPGYDELHAAATAKLPTHSNSVSSPAPIIAAFGDDGEEVTPEQMVYQGGTEEKFEPGVVDNESEPIEWVMLPPGQLPPEVDPNEIPREYILEEIQQMQKEEEEKKRIEEEDRERELTERLEGFTDAEIETVIKKPITIRKKPMGLDSTKVSEVNAFKEENIVVEEEAAVPQNEGAENPEKDTHEETDVVKASDDAAKHEAPVSESEQTDVHPPATDSTSEPASQGKEHSDAPVTDSTLEPTNREHEHTDAPAPDSTSEPVAHGHNNTDTTPPDSTSEPANHGHEHDATAHDSTSEPTNHGRDLTDPSAEPVQEHADAPKEAAEHQAQESAE